MSIPSNPITLQNTKNNRVLLRNTSVSPKPLFCRHVHPSRSNDLTKKINCIELANTTVSNNSPLVGHVHQSQSHGLTKKNISGLMGTSFRSEHPFFDMSANLNHMPLQNKSCIGLKSAPLEINQLFGHVHRSRSNGLTKKNCIGLMITSFSNDPRLFPDMSMLINPMALRRKKKQQLCWT